MMDMMNMPVGDKYQAKIIEYRDQKWVACPFCGKKQFPITPGAVILGQFFRCKASTCKQDFELNIDLRAM